MRKKLVAVAVATGFAFPLGAEAALQVFTANLNAAQQVQAVQSSGVGSFQAIYDDVANVFTQISLVGQNLKVEASPGVQSNVTGLSINGVDPGGGPAGANSGIALNLDANTIVRAGNVFSFNTTGVGGLPVGADTQATFSQSEEAHLLAGRSYVNLSTTAFANGEIRGQLAPVPEPETYALMLAGLGMVGFLTARRRKLF